jgi:hypothetical protein
MAVEGPLTATQAVSIRLARAWPNLLVDISGMLDDLQLSPEE